MRQSVTINNSYSNKHIILHGAPKSSVLGPLLFNIDLIDLFLECENDNINSYMDDITPYSSTEDMSSVITELGNFRWYEDNHTKVSHGKSRLLLSCNI